MKEDLNAYQKKKAQEDPDREQPNVDIGDILPFSIDNCKPFCLHLVIAGSFSSDNLFTGSMVVLPTKSYESLIDGCLPFYSGEDNSFFSQIDSFWNSDPLGDGLAAKDHPFISGFSNSLPTTFANPELLEGRIYTSLTEAYQAAKDSDKDIDVYCLRGSLPKAKDEIVVPARTLFYFFFDQEDIAEDDETGETYPWSKIGEDYLRSQGMDCLTVGFPSSFRDVYSPSPWKINIDGMPKKLKVVGSIEKIDLDKYYGICDPGFSLVSPEFYESYKDLCFDGRCDFFDRVYTRDYLFDNLDLMPSLTVVPDGYNIKETRPYIQGSARTMWIIVGAIFFAISLLTSMIYLLTILKELNKEDKLLTLLGLEKGMRLPLYLSCLLAILLPPFLFALIVSHSTFNVIVSSIYPTMSFALTFGFLYGFLFLFVAFLVLSGIEIPPAWMQRRRIKR